VGEAWAAIENVAMKNRKFAVDIANVVQLEVELGSVKAQQIPAIKVFVFRVRKLAH
jgi:hypothetical protein